MSTEKWAAAQEAMVDFGKEMGQAFSALMDGFNEAANLFANLELPSEPGKPLLEVVPGLTISAGKQRDLDTLRQMFPSAGNQYGKPQGMWADDSSAISVLSDGRFTVTLDRAKWQNYPNAALPLPRPVRAARISYWIDLDTAVWAWGQSGKLPGLARHKEGWFPGGGRIGERNFSDCPAWSTKSDGIAIGPYVYGQHRPRVPNQEWGPDYADGTLRWGAPRIASLLKGGRHFIELEHRPGVGPYESLITWKVDGKVRWQQTMALLGVGETHEITHCHFRVMFGGNALSYWPSTPFNTIEFSDFQIEELEV